VLIGAIPPLMLQTDSNPGGIPMSVFDGFRAALSENRAQFYREVASGPFYGFNRDGAEVIQGLIDNWWRQGMSGGAKAQYDCIAAFSETDFTADLEAIDVPILFLHGEDDQIVPIGNSAAKAVRLVRDGMLKSYPDLSHGMFATHPDLINADILAFIRGA
jgi:non-heme chloroperoxidase